MLRNTVQVCVEMYRNVVSRIVNVGWCAQRPLYSILYCSVLHSIVKYCQYWVVCSKGDGNKSPNTGISAQLILSEVTQMGIKATTKNKRKTQNNTTQQSTLIKTQNTKHNTHPR